MLHTELRRTNTGRATVQVNIQATTCTPTEKGGQGRWRGEKKRKGKTT